MSVFAMLAAGGGRLITQTITANTTVVIPSGVSTVDMSGYGARGTNGGSGTVDRWMKQSVNVQYRTDGSVTRDYTSQGYVYNNPGDSCSARIPVMNGTVDYVQSCTIYIYSPTSSNSPPTTGASAKALGRTFPGSYGNTTPAVTSFSAVPVTGGTPVAGGNSFSFVVPSGGSITISYYG